jgi:hypothetical protein
MTNKASAQASFAEFVASDSTAMLKITTQTLDLVSQFLDATNESSISVAKIRLEKHEFFAAVR